MPKVNRLTTIDFILWNGGECVVQPVSRRAWAWVDSVKPGADQWECTSEADLATTLDLIEGSGFDVMPL